MSVLMKKVICVALLAVADAWKAHKSQPLRQEDSIHALGLRPHHSRGQSKEDPLLFRHRYQHHDQTTNRLIYYQYEAKRHAHVIILSELGVESCIATPYPGGTAVLTMVVPIGDDPNRLRALKEGAIVLGGDINCTGTGGLPPVITELRERVLSDATLNVAQDARNRTAAEVTLSTTTAGFHECFEYSQMEFFHGCACMDPWSALTRLTVSRLLPAQERRDSAGVEGREGHLPLGARPCRARRYRVCEHGRDPA